MLEKNSFNNSTNYIDAKFNCNEYFLLGNLLAYSYKFSDKASFYYHNSTLVEQSAIDEFMQIAKKFPEIQSFINYGDDFDKLADNESRNELASNMVKRLEALTTVKNDDDLITLEGKNVMDAFTKLKSTKFYELMLEKTLVHTENLQRKFETYKPLANETLAPILQNLDKKEIETVVLPPQLFGDPYAIKTNGKQVTTLASYPEGFNENIPNLDVVSMIHEIIHTYIPVDENLKFNNTIQEDIYKTINHCLVELTSNGELGIKISNLSNHFATPMHQEIITDRVTGENLKKEAYIKSGIFFPEDFEFESTTNGFKGKQIITAKNELSNDKIRGIVYPYFLAFKNMNSATPEKNILNDINRDKAAITKIYGDEFYFKLENKEYLSSIFQEVANTKNIVELNSFIAEKVFGVRQKLQESTLNQDLYVLSSHVKISDFNQATQDVKNLEESNKHIETLNSKRTNY